MFNISCFYYSSCFISDGRKHKQTRNPFRNVCFAHHGIGNKVVFLGFNRSTDLKTAVSGPGAVQGSLVGDYIEMYFSLSQFCRGKSR